MNRCVPQIIDMMIFDFVQHSPSPVGEGAGDEAYLGKEIYSY
jgi:hypothetical protein